VLVVLCAMALTLALSGPAAAWEDLWQVRAVPTPVTGITPTFISADDSFLAWTGASSGTYARTYIYDLNTGTNTVIPASGISGPYYNPCAEDPWVVYQGARVGGYDDIYLYNVDTAAVTQITFNTNPGDWNDWNPRIDNGRVVWEKDMLGTGTNPGIYLYNIGTGTTQLLLAGDAYRTPDIDGDYVVCVRNSGTGNGSEVVLYQISTATTTVIANGSRNNEHPRIDGNRVVWSSGDIWTQAVPDTSLTYQIMLYDIGTATTTALTSNTQGNINPSINDNAVVWQTRNAPSIMCYNITTTNTNKISTVADTPKYPDISDYGAAWTGTTGLYFAVAASTAPRFPDVPTGHPYYTAIESIASQAIIEGFEDGYFRPLALAWRQQFAKMILLTMSVNDPGEYTPTLSDMCTFADANTITHVDGELYAYHHVAKAALTGLTIGYTDNTFRPFNSITRQQVITMIVRAGIREGALATPPSGWTGVLSYSDPTHGQNIRIAEYNGLLAGITGPGGTLSSWVTTAYANRGEVAQMLYHLLELLTP
jgi:Tol biopolymer transport system component